AQWRRASSDEVLPVSNPRRVAKHSKRGSDENRNSGVSHSPRLSCAGMQEVFKRYSRGIQGNIDTAAVITHGGYRARLHAASAGRTRFVISPPFSRSTSAMSYWLCKSSQNCALLPK